MKFLLVTEWSDYGALLLRIINEGNEGWLYIDDPKYRKRVFNNIVPKVNSIYEGIEKKPDVAIIPGNGLTKYGKILRDRGIPTLGGEAIHDKLEYDRMFAAKFAAAYGIRTPKTIEFTEASKGIEYLKSTKKRFVVKYDHSASFSSFMGDSNDDVMAFIKEMSEQGENHKFILQEFVDGGIEINTERWYCDGEPIYQANGGIEQKKFIAGDMGANSGNESYLVWPYENNESLALQRTLNKLDGVFKKIKYTGPIDIAAIINEKDNHPYFLEFTPRMGLSAIYNMVELMTTDIAGLLLQVAQRQQCKINLKDQISFSVTLSVAPYPCEHEEDFIKNVHIEAPLMDEQSNHLWLSDVHWNPERGLLTAGNDGLLMYVTSSDKTWKGARNKVASIIKNIKCANLQYRVDAGIQGELLTELKNKNYLKNDFTGSTNKPVEQIRKQVA